MHTCECACVHECDYACTSFSPALSQDAARKASQMLSWDVLNGVSDVLSVGGKEGGSEWKGRKRGRNEGGREAGRE